MKDSVNVTRPTKKLVGLQHVSGEYMEIKKSSYKKKRKKGKTNAQIFTESF